LNKDKKDRKGRGFVVTHTPPPSKRHRALSGLGLLELLGARESPVLTTILLERFTLHKERNPPGIGALLRENHSGRMDVVSG
jgi:hypothetical protein